MLTPFAHRKVVAEAARKHPTQVIPFGYVELDAPDVAQQVREFHDLGYRGLGELEFPRKPFTDRLVRPGLRTGQRVLVDRPVSHRHRAASGIRQAGGHHLGSHAAGSPRRNREAVSAADGTRCALRESRVRMGSGGVALEPQRLLRSEWVHPDQNAGTPESLPGRLLVVGRRTGHRHAQQRSQRVHKAGVRLRHRIGAHRNRGRSIPSDVRRVRRTRKPRDE